MGFDPATERAWSRCGSTPSYKSASLMGVSALGPFRTKTNEDGLPIQGMAVGGGNGEE